MTRSDGAVAAAYGWPEDISTEDALGRLLALNLERASTQESARGRVRVAAGAGALKIVFPTFSFGLPEVALYCLLPATNPPAGSIEGGEHDRCDGSAARRTAGTGSRASKGKNAWGVSASL
jgi:hypothetical protein